MRQNNLGAILSLDSLCMMKVYFLGGVKKMIVIDIDTIKQFI